MLLETESPLMKSEREQQLLNYIGELIILGNGILPLDDLPYSPNIDTRRFSQLRTGCLHLHTLLGPNAGPWDEHLGRQEAHNEFSVKMMLGALESLRFTIISGLLIRIEDLVAGQVFTDMLEQADYLCERTFDRAAAVLARGVLEEHLRRWCEFASLTPESPQINGYNTVLYKADKYDKVAMKRVEWLATVGNNAAHNKEVKMEDVKRMLGDVRLFLGQHPIS